MVRPWRASAILLGRSRSSIVPWSAPAAGIWVTWALTATTGSPAERLMLEPARRWPEGRFAVVGPMYPKDIAWPANVDREIHLSPRGHPEFYGAQRFTLNVTREAMKLPGTPQRAAVRGRRLRRANRQRLVGRAGFLFEIGPRGADSSGSGRHAPVSCASARIPDGARWDKRRVRRILAEHTPRQRGATRELSEGST